MSKPIVAINHVSKRYRLGQIGGTTLREELQRLNARIWRQEDPTRRVGTRQHQIGDFFMALDDVTLEVASGERLGIIGRNGAGKSTLLKLISRITAPTEGWIGLNGRVASMLEVGTGFHAELTGRENIYLNGAILGMKKTEIDTKIESIIDFSECAQFIDTPVKRYSSGMYVKLAFSVAAHLSSEIMIMDEVLAVGDVAFQKKCLDKMNEVSSTEGRTILYVSHNMNTIRQLCEKCAVLDHGKLIYLGDVEEAIRRYVNDENALFSKVVDLSPARRFRDDSKWILFRQAVVDRDDNLYSNDESIDVLFTLDAKENIANACLQFILFSSTGLRIGKTESAYFSVRKGIDKIRVKIPLEGIADGSYYYGISIFRQNDNGSRGRCDNVQNVIPFSVKNATVWGQKDVFWRSDWYGHVVFKPVQIL